MIKVIHQWLGCSVLLPLDAANSIMVITPQADYLTEIQQWLVRMDNADGGINLFSYELKYVKANELAIRLSEVFGGNDGSTGSRSSASVMPGLTSNQLSSSGSGLGEGASLNQVTDGNSSVVFKVDGNQVGIAAIDETNTLLVRSSVSAWQSIRNVIERLDVVPLQVHIEAQIAQVTLTGDLSYGVSWYLENEFGGMAHSS